MTDQELISALWSSAGNTPGEWDGNLNAYGYMRAAARRLESLLGISMNTAAALRYHPVDPQAKPAADGCICGTTIKGICQVHGGRLDNTQRADHVGYGKANYEAPVAGACTCPQSANTRTGLDLKCPIHNPWRDESAERIALSLAPVPAAPTMRQVVLTCGGKEMRLDAIFPSADEALAAIARILEGEFAADEARRSE